MQDCSNSIANALVLLTFILWSWDEYLQEFRMARKMPFLSTQILSDIHTFNYVNKTSQCLDNGHLDWHWWILTNLEQNTECLLKERQGITFDPCAECILGNVIIYIYFVYFLTTGVVQAVEIIHIGR